MGVKQTGCNGVHWLHLAQAGSGKHDNEPSGSTKDAEFGERLYNLPFRSGYQSFERIVCLQLQGRNY
jgi:hypothetical protein